jgi:hypothetical protein
MPNSGPSILHFRLLFAGICLIQSCSPSYQPYTGAAGFNSTDGIPDYRNLQYWAAHPAKKDPSDSIPAPLSASRSTEEADVFFLHPTTFTEPSDTLTDNARIDDPYINKKTDYSSILYQASVFNSQCRVFAPRYRQAHLRMYYLADSVRATKAFNLAYEDVRNAFLYYLENENNGRPIVIASHSQGTTHAKRLMREFFERDSTMRSKLVCAYLIGIPVEKRLFQQLVPCSNEGTTGCYIAWRTYRKGYEDKFISALDSSISVVNPYTWSSEPGTADKSMHKGAVLYKFNKVYRRAQSATVAGNALWISKPRFPGGFFYFTKNYHAGDYNLFYVDIRSNLAQRIRAYQLKHGGSQKPE